MKVADDNPYRSPEADDKQVQGKPYWRFGLVELLAVAAIVGLLVALLLPAIPSAPRFHIQDENGEWIRVIPKTNDKQEQAHPTQSQKIPAQQLHLSIVFIFIVLPAWGEHTPLMLGL